MRRAPITCTNTRGSTIVSCVCRQTLYRSLFKKEDRKFNTSLLNPALCPDQHFSIRIIDFKNRSNGKPIVWGAVIGLGEKFTLWEIILFPIYVLSNHGPTWNDMAWTKWVILFIVAPLSISVSRILISSCGGKTLSSEPFSIVTDTHGRRRVKFEYVHPREIVYDVSILFFVSAMLEQFVHLFYVQMHAKIAKELQDGIIVALLPNAVGIAFVCYLWATTRRSFKTMHSPLSAMNPCIWLKSVLCFGNLQPFWALLEITVSILLLFFLGAGFYGGPISIFISGIMRFSEMFWTSSVSTRHDAPHNRGPESLPGMFIALTRSHEHTPHSARSSADNIPEGLPVVTKAVLVKE